MSANTTAPPAKRPRIVGVAYAGDKIALGNYDLPLVVDLSGLTIPEGVALLLDHKNLTDARVGTVSARVENFSLVIEGEVSATSPGAKHVAEQGQWALSIGAEPTLVARVRSKETVEANGRTFEGPLYWVKKARLREVSIVAVGADAEASAVIAASWNLSKGNIMNETATLEPSVAFEPVVPDVAASHVEAVKKERERIAAIRAVCNDEYPDIEREAVEAGWTPDDVGQEVLKRIRANRPVADPRVTAWSSTRQGLGGRYSHNDLLANLYVRAGCGDLGIRDVGEKAIENVRSNGPVRFVELAHRCLAAEGKYVRSHESDEDAIRAALSTVSLPGVLNSFVRRNVETAYGEAPSVWRTFSAIRSVPDFRENIAYRLTSMEPLARVNVGGEIKHGTLGDEPVIRYAADTFAQVLTLDRRMVLNDDLSAFAEIARLMGVAASRTLDDLVWNTVLSNESNHFSKENNNLLAGPDSALSEVSLGSAITKLMTQKDGKGRVIGMDAHVLVVPPELLFTAKKLLESDWMNSVAGNLPDGVTNVPSKNVLRNAVTLACEPRISQMNHKAASASKWFLFARPLHLPAVTAFLDGRQTPVIKTAGIDDDLNHLAYRWRIFHDFGFALGDPRAAVMSAGQ